VNRPSGGKYGAGENSGRTNKVIGVFDNEEKSDLPSNRLPVWEGHMPSLHAKVLRHGAEHPNLESQLVHMGPELLQKTYTRQFDREM